MNYHRCVSSKLLSIFCVAAMSSFNAAAQESEAKRFRFMPDIDRTRQFNETEIQSGMPEGFEQKAFLESIDVASKEALAIGWFNYGDQRSNSVVVLLTSDDPRRLFVDLNRDRKFVATETIEADDDPNAWLVPLSAEFVRAGGEPIHQQQQIRIRFDENSGSLKFATAGTMKGQVEFQDVPQAAQYVDRDNSGRWFDPDDRLFVDMNGDGKLDPVLERLPCQGMRRIAGVLYAIAGDATGLSLGIVEVRDQGKLTPVLSLNSPGAQIVSIEATIASDNGIQIPIKELGSPVEVPVGTYHVDKIRLNVRDESGGYWFAFECENPKAQPTVVEANSSADIDLLGKLRINANAATISSNSGQTKILTPVLRSQTGLYLAGSRYGKVESANENRLTARSMYQGNQIHLGSSGFS